MRSGSLSGLEGAGRIKEGKARCRGGAAEKWGRDESGWLNSTQNVLLVPLQVGPRTISVYMSVGEALTTTVSHARGRQVGHGDGDD